MCVVFCTIEQLLVAASTFAIIQIGQSIGYLEKTIFWILFFAMLLFAVFIPRYGYLHFLLIAKYTTFQRFISDFEEKYSHHAYLSRNKAFINERKAVFHNETWSVVSESFDFMLDFF